VKLTMNQKVNVGLASLVLLVGLLAFTGIRAVFTLHESVEDIVTEHAQATGQAQTESQAAEAAQRTYRATLAWQFTLLALSLVAAASGGLWMYRITRGLSRTAVSLHVGAEQVMSAASEVATSAQSLSAGATHQAASLQETSASMTEMATMTRQNAENSQNAAGLMAELEAHVALSNQALRDMVGSMDSIGESSSKVAKIIKTIDEIAFQTNLLALNAAVEAARAGEAGMGFAVVADEVRNLAQRSAQAAKDTAGLIDEASRNAAQGGAKVEQVAVAITAITDSIAQVKVLVDDVNTASKQQAQGIQQVTDAVSEMEKVTQTTAATAEESAAASEELNAQAETTRHLVAELDALIGVTREETERVWAAARPTAAARPAAAGPTATVMSMRRTLARQRVSVPAPAAEAFIPFGDSGSFGSLADKPERSAR
jgi:methyl-accepting chemotaxis protein/methyl-accepting chemotaxis protein-1 (serine sensor receptor)